MRGRKARRRLEDGCEEEGVVLDEMPTARDLLRRVAERHQVEWSSTAIARVLGLADYSAPMTVARWMSGNNSPSFENTLLILEKAGMLRERHDGNDDHERPRNDVDHLIDKLEQDIGPDRLMTLAERVTRRSKP
jgi:transcriptional regulator with XRE-family HTH domain